MLISQIPSVTDDLHQASSRSGQLRPNEGINRWRRAAL